MFLTEQVDVYLMVQSLLVVLEITQQVALGIYQLLHLAFHQQLVMQVFIHLLVVVYKI
jgi:hypothetical protein